MHYGCRDHGQDESNKQRITGQLRDRCKQLRGQSIQQLTLASNTALLVSTKLLVDVHAHELATNLRVQNDGEPRLLGCSSGNTANRYAK
jgi:hypothetical protein